MHKRAREREGATQTMRAKLTEGAIERENEGGGLRHEHHSSSYSPTSSAFSSSTEEDRRTAATSLSHPLSPPSCLLSTEGALLPAVSMCRQLQTLLFWKSQCARAFSVAEATDRTWREAEKKRQSGALLVLPHIKCRAPEGWGSAGRLGPAADAVPLNPGRRQTLVCGGACAEQNQRHLFFLLTDQRGKGDKTGRRRWAERKDGEFWETHRLL